MTEYIADMILEQSEAAIERGNKFTGYLGLSPQDFSKEQLIFILNIIYDELQTARYDANEYAKRLMR